MLRSKTRRVAHRIDEYKRPNRDAPSVYPSASLKATTVVTKISQPQLRHRQQVCRSVGTTSPLEAQRARGALGPLPPFQAISPADTTHNENVWISSTTSTTSGTENSLFFGSITPTSRSRSKHFPAPAIIPRQAPVFPLGLVASPHHPRSCPSQRHRSSTATRSRSRAQCTPKPRPSSPIRLALETSLTLRPQPRPESPPPLPRGWSRSRCFRCPQQFLGERAGQLRTACCRDPSQERCLAPVVVCPRRRQCRVLSDERSAGCTIGPREGFGSMRLQSWSHEVSSVSGRVEFRLNGIPNSTLTFKKSPRAKTGCRCWPKSWNQPTIRLLVLAMRVEVFS